MMVIPALRLLALLLLAAALLVSEEPDQEHARRSAAIEAELAALRARETWEAERARMAAISAALREEAERQHQRAAILREERDTVAAQRRELAEQGAELKTEDRAWSELELALSAALAELGQRYPDLDQGGGGDLPTRLVQALDRLDGYGRSLVLVVLEGRELVVQALRVGPALWWLAQDGRRGGWLESLAEGWRAHEIPGSSAALRQLAAMLAGQQAPSALALPQPWRGPEP